MYEGGPSVMEGSAIGQGVSHDDVTNKAIAFNKDSHIKSVVNNLMEAWGRIVVKNPQNSFPGKIKKGLPARFAIINK